MDYDVLEEIDGYRVRLIADESADKPYDDGATPILTVESGRYGVPRVEAFNSQAEDYVSTVAAILERFDLDVLERFVKIFYGAIKLDSFYSEGIRGHYVAFDTAEWRERVGAPVESLKTEYYLSEVQAWAEGNVYGYIVERNVSYTKTWESGETEEGADWIEVQDGSCWGFYGYEYAAESAREALQDAIELERGSK